MRGALIIARLTLIEALRRQVQLLTFFMAVGIALLPIAVNAFGLGASDRVVKDVALTLIGLYATALSVFFGSVAIPGEIERKTLYPIVSRPMPRRAYLWGKWLGLVAFIAFSLFVLALTLVISMLGFMNVYDGQIWKALIGYFIEASILTATCLMFSTFSSPPLAAVLGLFVYIAGGLPTAFIDFFLRDTTFQLRIFQGLKLILPHFEFFHVKNAVVHHDVVPNEYILALIGYGVVWLVLIQLLADFLFDRKDL